MPEARRVSIRSGVNQRSLTRLLTLLVRLSGLPLATYDKGKTYG